MFGFKDIFFKKKSENKKKEEAVVNKKESNVVESLKKQESYIKDTEEFLKKIREERSESRDRAGYVWDDSDDYLRELLNLSIELKEKKEELERKAVEELFDKIKVKKYSLRELLDRKKTLGVEINLLPKEDKSKRYDLKKELKYIKEEIRWDIDIHREYGSEIYNKAMSFYEKHSELNDKEKILEKDSYFGKIKQKIKTVAKTSLAVLVASGVYYGLAENESETDNQKVKKWTLEKINIESKSLFSKDSNISDLKGLKSEEENNGEIYVSKRRKTKILEPILENIDEIENRYKIIVDEKKEVIGGVTGEYIDNNKNLEDILNNYELAVKEFPENNFGKVWMGNSDGYSSVLFETNGKMYSEIAYKNGEIILKMKNIATGELEEYNDDVYGDLPNYEKLNKYKEYVSKVKVMYDNDKFSM